MEAAQLAALGRHLQAVLPEVMAVVEHGGRGGQQPLEAKKLEGGQSNPTFLVHTPSGRRLVLRKKPGIVKVGERET
jgi:aminoglycoside phosphotransferase (APT) family kinase protein